LQQKKDKNSVVHPTQTDNFSGLPGLRDLAQARQATGANQRIASSALLTNFPEVGK
jgi:hypothetical protein